MRKNKLKGILCLFAFAAVAPDYAAYGQDTKGLTRSIIINEGDTTVNGKKFKDLSKDEQAKLREEFKEMGKNFRGISSIRSRGNDVVITEGRGRNLDERVRVFRDEPNTLHWNDDIGANVRSYSFDSKTPGDLKTIRRNGDTLLFDKDVRVFTYGGDSTLFHTDSLLKSFNFKMGALDSNIRKRVITMHRDVLPRIQGGMNLRGDGPPSMGLERRPFAGPMERNNSSSFNYSNTDKDGISSRMSIRIGEAGKEQLKKITGTEAITKSLDVSDLTLFPNFSSGKMSLSFNLANKGTAKVSVLDNDMKSIFLDEATNFSGTYIKQLTLPKNGVYYVAVSQNGNWFVKRLIKE